MSPLSLAGKLSNDRSWEDNIRPVPMLIARCLKGPYLHYAVCNVRSLFTLLSLLLANVN